jgi:hypothetical protein
MACPHGLFSQMLNSGLIWTDLECAVLFAKDIFPLLAFQNPEFKASLLLFYAEAN